MFLSVPLLDHPVEQLVVQSVVEVHLLDLAVLPLDHLPEFKHEVLVDDFLVDQVGVVVKTDFLNLALSTPVEVQSLGREERAVGIRSLVVHLIREDRHQEIEHLGCDEDLPVQSDVLGQYFVENQDHPIEEVHMVKTKSEIQIRLQHFLVNQLPAFVKRVIHELVLRADRLIRGARVSEFAINVLPVKFVNLRVDEFQKLLSQRVASRGKLNEWQFLVRQDACKCLCSFSKLVFLLRIR